MTVAKGKLDECLGMTIDFSLKQGVTMRQCDFIKKVWLELPDVLKGPHRNEPSPNYLLKAHTSAKFTEGERKEKCHGTTTKRPWLGQRSRPGFYCSREKSHD